MSMTVVETANGKVKGKQVEGVYAWKGIPYAKPPLGPLRFQPPEQPESWEGIRDATHFGPASPQPSREISDFLGNEAKNTSEDCLYLNVWSPGADDKRRPVMVWIHGGAFISGSGSSDFYDGTSFATEGDVVVVTINYRLGIMGFLHLGEIGGEEYATSGNCGILDQVAALRWVQENIEAFGGDPNRVTVFGESAGAMSIGVLLALPSAKGLFHQAILQSGAAKNALSSSKATKVAHHLLDSLDVGADELSKLVDMPIEKLVEASAALPSMSLQPVIDGVSLPEHPEKALAAGAAKGVPILIGTTKDEFRLFTFFDPIWKNGDPKDVANMFGRTFGSRWPKISDQFLDKGEKLTQTLYDQLMTLRVFFYPAIKLAEMQLEQDAPVWMYRFDWQSPVSNGRLKACHALEIPFVWNTIDSAKSLIGDSSDRQKVSEQMHQAWIAFALSGNPNTQAIPSWPDYDLENRSTMIFNAESRIEHDPTSEDRVNWEKVVVN
ncbi:carboxylesterase/lipase family protein [Halobacillus amylolyticus]|uniref:Carboxylic ester hydrolase n=1 Tax=Halobacillus amylolyticus TaxID=2932259 RepID=A0ABY4HGH5_9BACI|nr:carboxylesterase/lipase family protein [Halobacillus amylolyticus]UOR13729.1 carboxylesterase/lipase family protein [Halobacillus amylolyticus]